jgi:hypothetical protein
MVGGFSRGMKMAKIALENALEDFQTTVVRTREATRWKQDVADNRLEKGQQVCGDMLAKAVEAICKAEERNGEETRVRLMESNCDKLVDLAEREDKQAVSEAEPEPLIELGEEIEHRRENMVNLAKMLKENVLEEFKERAQRALHESAKVAKEGQRKLDDLRARLEFRSFNSEASSYIGHAPRVGEAAPEGSPFMRDPARERAGPGVGSQPTSSDIVTLLRGWGQLRANDSSWPVFDGRYASYPRFKKEWEAYRETYHSIVNDDLAAKTLREKCVKGDAHKMVGHLGD